MSAISRFFKVLSRVSLIGLLLLAFFAPPAYATETTCAETETGWQCTVWVNTFGEGPSFTFTLSEETDIVAKTFTSMTCSDWENAPHAYAADPHLWLYSVDTEGVLTQIAEDDDGHFEVNDGQNMCWDSKLELTLQAGNYSLRADAFDVDYIGTYTLEFINVAITPPTQTPEPTPTLDCSQYEINVGKYINSAEISFGQIVEVFVSQEALEDTCAYQLDSEIWVPVDDPAWANGDIFLSETPELPTPEPTPTPEPIPEPTPEPDPSPTPTPEPSPTPEPTPEPIPDVDPEPVEPPPPAPLPTPEPMPEPSPTPPPFVIIIPDDMFPDDIIDWDDIDQIVIDDIDWDEFDFDTNDGEPLVIEEDFPEDEDFVIDELPEILEEDLPEDEETLEEPEMVPEEEPEFTEVLDIEDIPEEYQEDFLEGPPSEDDIYFDETTGEWEDEPDLELEEVDVEELLEDEEALEDLIEELEADDVLDEILEDNDTFFEEAEEEELQELFEKAPEVFSQASSETKQEFEEEVNVFSGGFDEYQADGQTITIEERRTVVAATAVVSATAIAVRPAPPAPTVTPSTRPSGPSSGPSGAPTTRNRGRNKN